MEIVEHGFEQPRVALERGLVDPRPSGRGRRGLEQVERRQPVIVAQIEAALLRRLGLGRRRREAALGDHRAGAVVGHRQLRGAGGLRAIPGASCGSGPRSSRRLRRSEQPRHADAGASGSVKSRLREPDPQAREPEERARPAPGPQDRGRIADQPIIQLSTPAIAIPTTPPQPAGQRNDRLETESERRRDQHHADRDAAAASVPSARPAVAPQPVGADQPRRREQPPPAGRACEQQVGDPRARRAQQVSRRAARGGAERRIPRMIGEQRERRAPASRGTTGFAPTSAPPRRAPAFTVSRQSGGCARLAMIVTPEMSAVRSRWILALAESRVKAGAIVGGVGSGARAAGMDQADILILGGGLVGSALAVALDAHGLTSIVVDPADPAMILAAGLRRPRLGDRQRADADARGDRRGATGWRARAARSKASASATGSRPARSISCRDADGDALGNMFENRDPAHGVARRGAGGGRASICG